ncbi:MAG TPA: sodium-dependent transporter [Candidatus Acutalibacter stercorigallinarum]|nr:sodium-dependent transporter [Candidatus Acutalibacter stercorigallinarum]
MKEKRSMFSGKLGFVLAAAGSAVGLGNIWRFPYLAAKYGGGIFLLVYLVLVVSLGFSLMIAEVAIGRKTKLSAIGAFRKLSEKWKFLGYLASVVPIIIFPYYCVIGGWVVKYLLVYATGGGMEAAGDTYFNDYIAQPAEPILWLAVYIGLTAVIVFFGVQKGIEKASRIMMPALVVLTIGVAIYSVTRPGALEGVAYYLIPDFSRFSVNTVLGAMGQMFYSMSLAMGIMVTYGSYMKREDDLEKSVSQIEIFDTGIAFLAGLMVIPAVFAFSGGDEAALNQGAGLMFVTLPKVFADAGALGLVFGGLFFLLVLFAALTSSVSLMETVVSIFQDTFHWSRKFTCTLVMVACLVLALPSSLGYGLLDWIAPLGFSLLDFFDFISNSVLMPIVALLTCLFVGWVVKPKLVVDEVKRSSRFPREKLFVVVIRYVAPICILLVLISSVLDKLGVAIL